jgi:hypothetical protein
MASTSAEPDLDEVAYVVWWEAPHDGALRLYMTRDATVHVGRDPSCEVRIGALPVPDARVPRRWAQLSWHRGRVLVENLDDRWGLELVWSDGEAVVDRVTVKPQLLASAPTPEFVIVATVPSDASHSPATFEIHVVSAANPVRPNVVGSGADVVMTAAVVALKPVERTIGAALVAPIREGRGRRASLQAVMEATHYARSHVRDTVWDMDAKFISSGLAVPGDGDAFDRVAFVLSRHNLL